MRLSPPVVSIVVPCFNEEAALPRTAERLLAILEKLVHLNAAASASAVHFVDDGSSDRTWAIVGDLASRNPRVHGIRLSRNFGHQNALLAGMLTVTGDMVITIDADLQDDVNAIEEMVALGGAGADIVYGVRTSRQSDSWFKRVTGEGYYRLAGVMGVRLVYNHAD